MTVEVHVLDAKAHRFEDAETAAIHQERDQARHPPELGDHAAGFIARQDDGHVLRPPCEHHAVDLGQRGSQHLAIEEQDRRRRLVLGARRHPAVHRQSRQKMTNVRDAELQGMAAPAGDDEATNPTDVRRFRPRAHVPGADGLA